MFDWLDKAVDKLLPDFDKKTRDRAKATEMVVGESTTARKQSADAVSKAYDQAGYVFAHPDRKRN
jgi:hypothetical protein